MIREMDKRREKKREVRLLRDELNAALSTKPDTGSPSGRGVS
jgi:hypothetical protein